MLKPQWFQILLSLAEGERHGLAIMQEVLERTDGEMTLWPATLYGSLRKLVADGLVAEVQRAGLRNDDGDRRRFYSLTARGRSELAREVARMRSWVRLAEVRRVGS